MQVSVNLNTKRMHSDLCSPDYVCAASTSPVTPGVFSSFREECCSKLLRNRSCPSSWTPSTCIQTQNFLARAYSSCQVRCLLPAAVVPNNPGSCNSLSISSEGLTTRSNHHSVHIARPMMCSIPAYEHGADTENASSFESKSTGSGDQGCAAQVYMRGWRLGVSEFHQALYTVRYRKGISA